MNTKIMKQNIKSIKNLIKSEAYNEAFELIKQTASPLEGDYVSLYKLATIASKIPSGALALKPIRIAIVSSSTIEHFAAIFKFTMALDGFDAELFLPEFGTVHQSILNSESDLYEFKPDIIWIFTNYRDVIMDIQSGCTKDDTTCIVNSEIEQFQTLWNAVSKYSDAFIVQNNADIPLFRTFGNYEGNECWARVNRLREFNLKLADAAVAGLTILDFDYLSSVFGKAAWSDERLWYHSKHAFSLEASGMIAFAASRLIKGMKGQSKKCIVLDLDNTLWGGVIGDDGLNGIALGAGADGEAFKDFQKYLLELKDRGLILCVCSKNEEENALLPFNDHPDMLIKSKDIAVFVANWNNKADNIRNIVNTLDIGMDSVVFIDDNPVERALVKEMLPEVAVPEMPIDPTGYIRAIDKECFFETVTFSNEDRARSDMYKNNAQRKQVQAKFSNLDDFLKSLEMEAFSSDFDATHLPRISQLINKSNQFHLTTTRYSEKEIQSIVDDDKTICRYFKLRDRFGDNGLISLYILKPGENGQYIIDTFVMSCRVLSRGMEDFVYNDMINVAKEAGASLLSGVYKPTAKNGVVANLYDKLEFTRTFESSEKTIFDLNINDGTPLRNNFVNSVDCF